MDIRFAPHNTHLEDATTFADLDPHLRQLKRQPLVYRSALLDRIPGSVPGIYTLTGGRQIGKTTLLKQWMLEYLNNGCKPQRIIYLTGELIDDHHALIRLISEILAQMPQKGLNFLIIDEITYIHSWDKGVKYLADAGLLENFWLMLTGSDSVIIKDARKRFPGRRGLEGEVDFHLYPLSFYEFVRLKGQIPDTDLQALVSGIKGVQEALVEIMFAAFDQYLIHGGFLTAINEMARQKRILPATFATYSDWIRGDVLKRNKREHYLREIMQAVIKRYGSQITFNSLAQDLSIDHPQTVADYLALLSSMDAVFIQSAIIEDKLTAAPKKAKKLMFADPFIFHSIYAWLNQSNDPFKQQVLPRINDPDITAKLVEACAATQYRRYFPTYYLKGTGEVDIAYVNENRFWPVEIKWTHQMRPKSIKQIRRYPNGLILTKNKSSGKIDNIPAEPLPLALLKLGASFS